MDQRTIRAKERILVVDDCPDNLFLMQLILETHGYEVEVANSGREALRKVGSRRMDLILLDLMMPEMNGYEVIKHLQERNLPFVPIFIVTANKYVTKKEAHAAGANDIIFKPVDINILLTKIAKFLDIEATS